jgi:hypothetical protein
MTKFLELISTSSYSSFHSNPTFHGSTRNLLLHLHELSSVIVIWVKSLHAASAIQLVRIIFPKLLDRQEHCVLECIPTSALPLLIS